MEIPDNDNNNINKKLSSSQLRKIKKPLIEKRRRERINESLTQLKTLILEALNKDESQYNKMEKADILELTVKHLRNLHKHDSVTFQPEQQNSLAITQPILQTVQLHQSSSPPEVNNYKAGFAHCATEVNRFMQSIPAIKTDVKNQISNLLNGRIYDISSKPDVNNTNNLPVGKNTGEVSNTVGTAYVQILPKESSDVGSAQECLGSSILHGIPYVQSIPVINGQTIVFANALPGFGSSNQLQPILQLTQPVLANSKLQEQQQYQQQQENITFSPNYKENVTNDVHNTILSETKSNNNDWLRVIQEPEPPTNDLFKAMPENCNKRSNINAHPYRKGFKSATSTLSKSSLTSLNQNELNNAYYENRTVYSNRNLNNLTVNSNDSKINYRQTHEKNRSNISSQKLFHLSDYSTVQNQVQVQGLPQCIDNMWRPW